MPDPAAQIIKRTHAGASLNESSVDPRAAEIVMEPRNPGVPSCL